jgi:hypothetical protein
VIPDPAAIFDDKKSADASSVVVLTLVKSFSRASSMSDDVIVPSRICVPRSCVVDIRHNYQLPTHLNVAYSAAPAARNEPDSIVPDDSNMLIAVDELSFSSRKTDVLNPRFIVILGPTK